MLNSSVSVVIPAFNCESTIARAINSVLNQTMLPLEIIVVDDQSTDGTLNKLQEIQSTSSVVTKIFQTEVNSGPGLARNLGWDNAAGDYVAFLDADDSWVSFKLEKQVKFLQANPEFHAVSGQSSMWTANGAAISEPDVCKFSEPTLLGLMFKNPIKMRTVVLRRSIEGRFSSGYSEDYGLWLQLLVTKHRFAVLRHVLAYHYKHEFGAGGLSANLYRHETYEIRRIKSVNGSLPVLIIYSAMAFSYLKFARRVLISYLRKII